MSTKKLEKLRERLNPQIDYVGQELSTKLLHSIFMVGFPASLLCGMFMCSIWWVAYPLAAVLCVALVCVVPGWSIYRRHPVAFGEKKTK